MEATIKVKQTKINGDWCNILTTDGKQVSVNMVKAPKTAEALIAAQDLPFDLTGELVTKDDGKMFLWDIKPKSDKKPYNGKTFDPISSLWLNAMNNATGLLTAYAAAGTKVTAPDVIKMANEFFTEGLKHIKQS